MPFNIDPPIVLYSTDLMETNNGNKSYMFYHGRINESESESESESNNGIVHKLPKKFTFHENACIFPLLIS